MRPYEYFSDGNASWAKNELLDYIELMPEIWGSVIDAAVLADSGGQIPTRLTPKQALRVIRASKGTGNAFDVAKNGGKHFYNQYINKSEAEIKKRIQSIEKQDKIKNPEKYYPDFKNLDPRQQDSLINKKWPSGIERQMDQKQILEGILKDK